MLVINFRFLKKLFAPIFLTPLGEKKKTEHGFIDQISVSFRMAWRFNSDNLSISILEKHQATEDLFEDIDVD